MMHKVADSPYYSLLDKHLREYRAALCPGAKNLVQVVKKMLVRHKMSETRKWLGLCP